MNTRPSLKELNGSRQSFGTVRTEPEPEDLVSQGPKKVPSQTRSIVLAVLSALFMAIAATARGVASDTPFSSQFFLSFVFLVMASVLLGVERRKKGAAFKMPWWVEKTDSKLGNVSLVFDWKILALTATSGLCSLISGLTITLGYLEAVSSNSNQGIPSTVYACYIIPCSIICWFFFGEKLSFMQSFGILISVCGVIYLGVSKPQDAPVSDDAMSGGSYTLMIVYGALTLALSCTDNLSVKYLFDKIGLEKSMASLVGAASLFIYGVVGTICLVVSTCMGYGLYSMGFSTLLMVVFAGIFVYAALTCLLMSVAIGSAGLSVAIFISFAGIQAAICYFFLHQQMTFGQVSGMLI